MPDCVAVLYRMLDTAESKNTPSKTVGGTGLGVTGGVTGLAVTGGVTGLAVVPLPVAGALEPPSPPPPPQALRKQKEMLTSSVQANFFMYCQSVAG